MVISILWSVSCHAMVISLPWSVSPAAPSRCSWPKIQLLQYIPAQKEMACIGVADIQCAEKNKIIGHAKETWIIGNERKI